MLVVVLLIDLCGAPDVFEFCALQLLSPVSHPPHQHNHIFALPWCHHLLRSHKITMRRLPCP